MTNLAAYTAGAVATIEAILSDSPGGTPQDAGSIFEAVRARMATHYIATGDLRLVDADGNDVGPYSAFWHEEGSQS